MHIPPHNSPSPLPIKNPPSSITPTMMEAGTTTTTTSTSATTTTGDGFSPETPSSIVLKWTHTISRRFQHILDKTTPHILYRWITLISIALIYSLRVYMVQAFYIVSYGLGIYILNLLIAFLSPQVDPEIQQLTDGPTLPVLGSDEFRPFVRRLPEFKFCYSLTKAFCIAFVMTFFDVFDVPVFWPILLFYWVVLFTLTMRRQIHHMIKYRYVPFSFGKKRYDERRDAGEESAALVRD